MPLHAVTGAFGYSGGSIARQLLAQGVDVRTLTNSPGRHSALQGRVQVHGLDWKQPAKLRAALRGVEVLYNTYWVRFNHGDFSFAQAVANTKTLFEAAQAAGVRRIVHVSITNPDERSALGYFRGKGEFERTLRELSERTGVSYAILRPAVLFGGEDILINNIAWMLRRLPVFGVFGDGAYKLQPIHVEDLAELAVRAGGREENMTIDAIGPETFTYRELVETIGAIIGVRRRIVQVHPEVGYGIGKVIGWWMGDLTITREEIQGLMEGRLYTQSPLAGETRLSEWAREHREELGRRYASELGRRRDRERGYGG